MMPRRSRDIELKLLHVMPKKTSRTKAVVCPGTGRAHAGHIDPRAARSRAAIQATFLGLIVERGYDAIDVQDVCAKAGVSRATFYAHFAGKDDLKRKGIDEMRRELAKTFDAAGQTPFAFSGALFEHARRHLPLYRALLGGRGAAVANGALRDALRELVRQDLTLRRQKDPKGLAVEYYAGALFSIITWWLGSGARRPAAEIDAEFRKLANSHAGA
jgi:AcrR family transcriptional regulator